ncbi:MAG: hypothetical protein IPL32_06775 [Chloracidobacterium sp.]|nr:hypothetical protein [Chloracidobacterium sp.]
MNAKNWKYALLPTLFMVFLAMYPQINFRIAKGSAWHGAYFVANFDEVAYSAYVNALINGKPRKYDQYMAAELPHESLYSIQFIPAYTIAMPAKLLGISASTAFIFLNILCSALAALFIFWLLFKITGDGPLAATGVLMVCCLGTAVAYEGELRDWTQGQILVDFFPFLRRYQPGFAFSFFFLFCGSVWFSLNAETRKKAILYSLMSGIIFVLLIYSYFFLWTAAAAWLACVFVLSLIWHRENLKNLLTNAAVVGGIAIAALIPYAMMLSERGAHIDSIQLLANTRLPDLDSPSMIFGSIVSIAIAILIWRGGVEIRSPQTLFALAFAVTPLVLFNQQIVTGHSLQPIHYEVFIANYMVLIALALLLFMVLQKKEVFRKALLYIAIIAAGWGVVEATGSTSRNSQFADLRDLAIPAIRYVEKQEQQSSTKGSAVYAANTGWSDFIPTIADLRPLWTSHTTSAGGIGITENKRLFHCYLYYGGYGEKDVEEGLKAGAFEITAALFGSERALPALGTHSAPITAQEISAEVKLYGDFIKNFSKTTATQPLISYAILPAEEGSNLDNIDKWYERDAGTVTGLLKVYKLKLKP